MELVIWFRRRWGRGRVMLGVVLRLANGEFDPFALVGWLGFGNLGSWDRIDGNRCVRASLFGSFGQLDGTAGIVSGTDHVLINYTRSADELS